MKLLITGSSGFIGSALMSFMTAAGHDVRRLLRSSPTDHDLLWSPEEGLIDLSGLGEIDAVIHLAGENIASGRWTAAKKARITDSRVKGTGLLAKALAKLEYKPKVLVSASGIGFYGHRGDEKVDETSQAGEGFFTKVNPECFIVLTSFFGDRCNSTLGDFGTKSFYLFSEFFNQFKAVNILRKTRVIFNFIG